MCCSLTYKDGPRTIVIEGFPNVSQAVAHANNKEIDSFWLEVKN